MSPIILLLRKYRFKYDAKKAGEILNLSIQDIPGFSNSVKGLLLTVLGKMLVFNEIYIEKKKFDILLAFE